MAEHNELGRWGERVAREFLLSQGYAIDCLNLRIGNVEVDFIARKDNRLCFIEVKTRGSDLVDPADAVDRKKRRRLIRAADMYMQGVNEPLEPQFDLIIIIGGPDGYEIEHVPDAFYPKLDG